MVTVWWRIRLVGWVIADLHAHAGYSSQRNVRVSCMASWINTSLIWMSFHRGGQASMWWVTLQEKQTKTNMAPTSKLRRIQQTLTVSLHRWPAQKIDKNSTFHLDGHTVGFRPQNHLPRPPSTPTGYRVQRKSVLHSGKLELVRTRPKVISNSRKKIFDEQDWLRFSAFESPHQKKPSIAHRAG